MTTLHKGYITMDIKVHAKETTYFWIMSALSLCAYIPLGIFIISKIMSAIMIAMYTPTFLRMFIVNMSPIMVLMLYVFCFWLFQKIVKVIFWGHLRGNAIKIDDRQFPEVAAIVKEQCKALSIDKVPEIYLLQSNGVLNAFAARLARKNVVILYSAMMDVAYQDDGMDALAFIIGHELGHIKRGHVDTLKSMLIWPASWNPFLNLAYSRACEYTCDNIGYALCPKGAFKGLLVLGAGKHLYSRISMKQLLHNKQNDACFATRFAEIFSSHPALLKRVNALYQQDKDRILAQDQHYMTGHIESQQEVQQ